MTPKMNEPPRDEKKAVPAPAKKYSPPEVVSYGTVKEITQTGPGANVDGMMGSQ